MQFLARHPRSQHAQELSVPRPEHMDSGHHRAVKDGGMGVRVIVPLVHQCRDGRGRSAVAPEDRTSPQAGILTWQVTIWNRPGLFTLAGIARVPWP